MTEQQDIVFRQDGPVGHVTLNRPKALNALTLEMCRAMLGQLRAWAEARAIHAIVVDAAPGRAFCAGGDMRAIWEWVRTSDPRALEFFAAEYKVNAAIAQLCKPCIAILDGIVMGGGAGISIHGSHRIVTENTVFAMPETALGFFPDVGASYFLSRLPGGLGVYLGLTGAHLNAADTIYADLATHYVPSARAGQIAGELAGGRAVGAVLAQVAESAGVAPLAALRPAIDRVFTAPTVEEILLLLEKESRWGAETAALMGARSPTSLKLVLRQLQEGKRRNLQSCLDMEYGIAARLLSTNDFQEGVRAVLIDKGRRPRWHPAQLCEVSAEAVDHFFDPGPPPYS